MRKIHQLKLVLLTIFLSLYVFAFSAPVFGAQVTYCSHIANVGWLSWVSDGQTSGSPGSGNQMEAVQIKTAGFPSTYHIDYQAHVSYIGWQGWVSDGQTAGTVGEAKAMEAIQIKLRGFPSNYHVKYKAYVQNIGWQGWVEDGTTAGTTGQGKAIEALAVEIYADPSNIPPEAKITMASQGQTAYENETLNLLVAPGGTAHVDFSASRSSDPDGSVTSYQWYINGQPVSTSRDFDYDLGAGTHQIYLEVWDNQGAEGAVGATIVISENNIVYLDNGIVRVGVDLGQGGAIVEISYQGYNLVDTNDPGRLIQVSFWDDADPNWNPIQAGDITGHLNPVTDHSSDSNSIYTKARGINWVNTGPDPQWLDVDIEQWVILEDQKVKVKYRVTHFGLDEHVQHHQEFPSVYLRTELFDSVSYLGDNPWNSDQVEYLGIIPGESKFVMPTEHWVGFVNTEDFGLTIYSPYHTLLWKAERILGESDPNYIAVVDQFGLMPASVHETEVYFIVGNYPDSRQLIYELELQNDAPRIDSIDPDTIEPSDFTLRIYGSNFDQAIDQIYWKADGHLVGQAPEIISQSETELVLAEKMATAEPGTYLVTVRNFDGKLSNFVEMFIREPSVDPCECDLNNDHKCDMEDWLIFGEDWGRTDCGTPPGSGNPPNDCECDLNDDGRCDMEDWLLFGEDWGRTDCPH